MGWGQRSLGGGGERKGVGEVPWIYAQPRDVCGGGGHVFGIRVVCQRGGGGGGSTGVDVRW
eukprot:756959-Hanusia_phi.AAC.5